MTLTPAHLTDQERSVLRPVALAYRRAYRAGASLAALALPLEIRGNQRLGSVGHFRRHLPRQSGLEGNG